MAGCGRLGGDMDAEHCVGMLVGLLGLFWHRIDVSFEAAIHGDQKRFCQTSGGSSEAANSPVSIMLGLLSSSAADC